MSFSAAEDLKEQVRAATNIVDLIGSYLQVQQRGRGYLALCPWHDDSRPSLQINPDRQTWKCWPCDIGGDIFSFVMRRENVEFPEALRLLAERAGIEVAVAKGPKAQPGGPNDKQTLYQAMAWAERQFHHCLTNSPEAAPARDYLRSRGINEDSIERYHIGFAPNEWQWLTDRTKATSFSNDVVEALGLIIRNERNRVYDRFRGRVMFPIRDPQRRPIAVGGRILPELADEKAAKYINSPETRLYTKSEQLYGLDVAKDSVATSRQVLVTEGYTDVILCRQAGVDNVVAVCGTALGERHVRLLKRYADRITLVLDGDEAGQKRAAEILGLFISSPVELRIATLPDGLDPCDFVLQQGLDAFRDVVDRSVEALDFHIRRVTAGIDLVNDTHRANQALQQILEPMSRAPKIQTGSNELIMREHQTLIRVARLFRVEEAMLRNQLVGLRRKASYSPSSIQEAPRPALRIEGWDHELFVLLIRHPDAVSAVIENISQEDMRTEAAKQLLGIYQQLEADGFTVEHQRLLDATEDPEMKHLLVELCDVADRMETEDAELQLRDLISAYAGRRERDVRRRKLADLDSNTLSEEEQLALLNQFYESKKEDS